jgi:quinol monooxygenase YgiN
MKASRRQVIAGVAALGAASSGGFAMPATSKGMYGRIGKMRAKPGQRDTLVEILLQAVGEMPGCRSYVVATDADDAEAIWITEVWDSRESHRASLSMPVIRYAISKAKPLIAGFEDSVTTRPVGGHGLA